MFAARVEMKGGDSGNVMLSAATFGAKRVAHWTDRLRACVWVCACVCAWAQLTECLQGRCSTMVLHRYLKMPNGTSTSRVTPLLGQVGISCWTKGRGTFCVWGIGPSPTMAWTTDCFEVTRPRCGENKVAFSYFFVVGLFRVLYTSLYWAVNCKLV